MTNRPVEKDVEAILLKERKCMRKPGEVPYPLEYSTDILNFAHWDHMFLVSYCRSLTIHQFDEPPAMVLDLGCGSGFWAIEAAQQWKNSTIIGFDIKDIQPRLRVLDFHQDLSRRVKWAHGNLLDGLPFHPNYFDFVRIVGIGLGVPEDEWQFVLEEVARIMKPGAVLEIVEEDLIFPCGRPPRSRPRPPPLTVDLPVSDSMPSSGFSARSFATQSSDRWSITPDEPAPIPLTKKQSLNTLHESCKSMPTSPPSFSPSFDAKTSFLSLPSHRPAQDSTYVNHPQDHTRLKTAWDAMLSSRFLAPKLVTVLPFYLSSFFVDVRTLHTLQISLPLNSRPHKRNGTYQHAAARSRTICEWFDPDVHLDLTPSPESMPENKKSPIGSTNTLSQDAGPSWSTMHLARTVGTINGCKESIWIEYEKLYGNDPSVPPVTRTTRPNEVQSKASKPSSREAFEWDWSNWENDMMDRIGMRGCIFSECSWKEPRGERPEWRVWRDGLDIKGTPDACLMSPEKPELCRSLRGFVGWKPS